MLKMRRLIVFRTLKFAIVITIVIGIVMFARQYLSLYLRARELKQTPAKTQELQQKIAKKLMGEVNKIMESPLDELPTVVTVTDSTNLAKDPFFEKAKNGDKVLIYSKAGKAVLYDPKRHEILAFTTISLGNQNSNPTPSPTTTPTPAPARVAIRNGSGTVGAGAKAKELIVKTIPGSTIVSVRDATLSDYTESIVVVLDDKSTNTADQLSELVKGKVDSLPTGELAPSDTDVLIIIGSAFNYTLSTATPD
ncbi:MAG: LytR C-terminal domain-containing protein [bacterium]